MKINFCNCPDKKSTIIYTPKELQEIVGTSVSYYVNQVKELRTELNKTKKEMRQEIQKEFENEIQNLKSQLRCSIAVLSSEKELKDYKDFVNKHLECRDKSLFTGGQMPIIRQVGTGLGTCTEIQCPICKEKKDITDTSIW